MYFTAEMLPHKFSSTRLEGTRLCHTKARMFLKLSPRTQTLFHWRWEEVDKYDICVEMLQTSPCSVTMLPPVWFWETISSRASFPQLMATFPVVLPGSSSAGLWDWLPWDIAGPKDWRHVGSKYPVQIFFHCAPRWLTWETWHIYMFLTSPFHKTIMLTLACHPTVLCKETNRWIRYSPIPFNKNCFINIKSISICKKSYTSCCY